MPITRQTKNRQIKKLGVLALFGRLIALCGRNKNAITVVDGRFLSRIKRLTFLTLKGPNNESDYQDIQYAKFRLLISCAETLRYFKNIAGIITHFIRFKPFTKILFKTLNFNLISNQFNSLAIYLSHTLKLNERPTL